ncbi:CoA transferase [Microbacterium sp. ZOR0019]|uniref:CoA transferase n=1 Tax=Microbacterium sp. ZOR0019 TaxID=1339233 RepID=UPI0006914467|nr:CoA transferase [Microbacterium sp. ZOR0019]
MPTPPDEPLLETAHAQADDDDRRGSRDGGELFERVLGEIGIAVTDRSSAARPVVPLSSRLDTATLAWGSVSAVMVAAGGSPESLDPARVAVAYGSDRVLTVDGAAPPVWSPYSGFWRTSDGWIRTHGNYPHHAARLRAGLGLREGAGAEAVRDVLAEQPSAPAVAAITAAGGLAVRVMAEAPATDRLLGARPLLEINRVEAVSPSPSSRSTPADARSEHRPLQGMRVLDLTRVIAGPVCTRTLALLGADVLRIDPPQLPEPEWQHLDTGHGKRSAVLDARDPQLEELIERADAVVLGYRPAALDRLGLNPEELARRHSGLVVAQLSAWGTEHPDRAGFDSLVQAESGIALIESPDGDRPGALPVQALDHSAGYLLAAAVTRLLRQRPPRPDGSWVVRTSLRRVAAELLLMPRRRQPNAALGFAVDPHVTRFVLEDTSLTTARPALPGFEFDAPHPWGSDQPRW